MGDKKQGQIIIDQPGMTHVITKEYLILPFTDIAVNKKFFMCWTVFLFVAFQVMWSAVLGAEAVAAFYAALLIMAWNFHIAHPLMFVVDAVAIGIIVGIVWYSRRRYKAKHMTSQELYKLQELRKQAYGGELNDG